MIKVLFAIVCVLAWIFRGGAWIKAIHGYYRGLLTSFVIVGSYCLCIPQMSVFSPRGVLTVVCLAALEGLLGYGSTCEKIDYYYISSKSDITNFLLDDVKELYLFLGFISMSYYLFPAMIMNNTNHSNYAVIAILGFMVFPVAKYSQLKWFNKLPTRIDTWKIVEGIIGLGFIIWLIK